MKIIDKIKKYCKNNGRILRVVNNEGKTIFYRYCFMRRDEYWSNHRLFRPLPWWMPFNVFMHEWEKDLKEGGLMHSHPRWSITIVLRGEIQEVTPKHNRLLRKGHIVFRTHKSIHKFFTSTFPKEKCVTLFIVGRRKYTQYSYDDCLNITGMMDGAQNPKNVDKEE